MAGYKQILKGTQVYFNSLAKGEPCIALQTKALVRQLRNSTSRRKIAREESKKCKHPPPCKLERAYQT